MAGKKPPLEDLNTTDRWTKEERIQVKAYMSHIGRNGGKAARGEAKLRGDSEYYRAIGKLGLGKPKKYYRRKLVSPV